MLAGELESASGGWQRAGPRESGRAGGETACTPLERTGWNDYFCRMTRRLIRLHGHFYQPPRENPWLETVEIQDSAAPYHDWNARVTAECYAPNTAARLLDAVANSGLELVDVSLRRPNLESVFLHLTGRELRD